jgi:hypothetical protein
VHAEDLAVELIHEEDPGEQLRVHEQPEVHQDLAVRDRAGPELLHEGAPPRVLLLAPVRLHPKLVDVHLALACAVEAVCASDASRTNTGIGTFPSWAITHAQ